jgi:hypothetical protein
MTTVHYYLGRPARVWISAHSRRSPARQSRTGSEHIRSGHPSDVAPAGGLLARQRIAIARFGTEVAAAGGIGPALAAGLDPAGYPVVPGGVPQAWERAQVYLGLYERYQELYQAQVTELHLLMATAPGCSLPLSHRRPLTDPLTDTHTGYISLNYARLQQTKRKGQIPVQNGGTARVLSDVFITQRDTSCRRNPECQFTRGSQVGSHRRPTSGHMEPIGAFDS